MKKLLKMSKIALLAAITNFYLLLVSKGRFRNNRFIGLLLINSSIPMASSDANGGRRGLLWKKPNRQLFLVTKIYFEKNLYKFFAPVYIILMVLSSAFYAICLITRY